MLGNLLGGFIVILVGVNIMPSIADGVWDAQNYYNGTHSFDNPNTSTSTDAILGLTTIFFAIGIMASGVALAVQGLKNAGMV